MSEGTFSHVESHLPTQKQGQEKTMPLSATIAANYHPTGPTQCNIQILPVFR